VELLCGVVLAHEGWTPYASAEDMRGLFEVEIKVGLFSYLMDVGNEWYGTSFWNIFVSSSIHQSTILCTRMMLLLWIFVVPSTTGPGTASDATIDGLVHESS
jgi:hypothetical protein